MSKNVLPIAKKISRVYQFVALIILIIYAVIFKLAILGTENKISLHHLSITAPHHFQQYQQGATGTLVIDPLLTLYDDYQQLPHLVKRRLNESTVGLESFHFEDDSELAVLAESISTPMGEKKVWAVFNIDATEWNDESFILIEVVLFALGILIFLTAGIAIKKIAERIAKPFEDCAEKLNCPQSDDFSLIKVSGEASLELINMASSINAYRSRIARALSREKNFTRYISHEIRTPMTVIKGCLSLLKRDLAQPQEKQINRISDAVNEMENLTNVFLLLARQEDLKPNEVDINLAFITDITDLQQHLIAANNNQLTILIDETLKLDAEPLLIETLIKNLTMNAINCTEQGTIIVKVNQSRLSVIDTGIGLDAKPRGYDGFGIGLTLVKDICKRYNWHFSLSNNETGTGCCATVTFQESKRV